MTSRVLHVLFAATAASMFSIRAAEPTTNAVPDASGHGMAAPQEGRVVGATNVSATADFNLAGGVVWKKFRKVKDRFVLGQPAEGRALAIFNMSLRSKNAELAAEARSILDAIAETRDVLGERLEAELAAGRPDVEDWISLYLKSFPSRRARFARTVKPRGGKVPRPAK